MQIIYLEGSEMIKTFKYRLYADRNTIENAIRWIDLCRFLYNCALEQRIWVYRHNGKSISFNEQQNELPLIKRYLTEYKEVGAQTLLDVLWKLDKSYKYFFSRVKKGKDKKGFPRFKSERRYNSFTLTRCNWKIDGKYLSIYKLGRFKLNLHRPIEGKIKSITIKRTPTNKWYACFNCSIPLKLLPKSTEIVGIDVGIKSFIVDSNGNKTGNPKFLKSALRVLRTKQRKLSRAKIGSNRRKKTKLQLSKLHEKITNQRNDFLHKVATKYVKEYGVIKVENLRINNMSQNHKLAASINDCSWGKFFNLLSYKAEEAGRELVKVPSKNTSKRCNECGSINHELKLIHRIWICKNCGITHDRDKNAAINIRNSEVRAEPSVVNVKQEFVRRPRIIEKYKVCV